MQKVLSSTPAFILLYFSFMVPTYILPYFGSNSLLITGVAAAGGYTGPNVGFWIHLSCLIALVVIAKIRTARLTKGYLYIFPLLALAFDLIPVLSSIPLIPTFMHVVTLVMGVALAKQATGTAHGSITVR